MRLTIAFWAGHESGKEQMISVSYSQKGDFE
jgi:hypothetical protein